MRNRTLLTALILTAALGRITYGDHAETWYNLDMTRVVSRAHDMGIPCEYWVRDDGVKMYGPWVICAADWNVHPYGSTVETSKGLGIVLDHHTAKNPELIDIATAW